ncbi:hypothetical protein [Bradyrhizobium sp. CCBAU 11361]|uniref:hypothetical protein n=1 Tax=Bradyrhizobium sp. CCBAU 11361 TaxID=1630812 RepID=UPI0023051E47|nr:hypothetical protein [Bradyrhizobium sp. CCBAU 11361]MDA9491890.1 hypothetical protein [Bradyrhizobium sp. CCBAU 11361]
MQSLGPEQQFVLTELWTLAWAASVQRANLYAPGSKQTGQLRDKLQELITTQLLPHYVRPCTERQHYLNLAQLVEFGTAALPSSLRDGRYRYGVAQKLLNLVLKYHWCQGVEPLEISLWLGHLRPPDSVETTLVYSPFCPDYLINAKAAVEAFVREIASHCRRHDILNPPWLD